MFLWCSKVEGGLRVHLIPKNAHSNVVYAIRDKQIGQRVDVAEASEDTRLAVVRHPLERIVAAYTFFCKERLHLPFNDGMKDVGYKREMTFNQFLEHLLKNYEKNVHTQKQVDFLGGQDIDILIPIEKLQEVWPSIMTKWHVKALDERLANHSYHDPWETFYTPEQRKLTEETFKEDLDIYNLARGKYNG